MDTSTGALAPSDTQLTKFHGIYQQDDRDIRDERNEAQECRACVFIHDPCATPWWSVYSRTVAGDR